ncbi:MAG: hypothetical protein JJT96_12960 [Opitutales bacterium]|nr:hypothetical protein [Opitutales bacterium]
MTAKLFVCCLGQRGDLGKGVALDGLDWWVIGFYLAGMVALSAWLGRFQESSRDYYLAGNRARPLPVALSTLATQCSTNSLLGAPAFVAFAGGLVWLQYELAVPFAMTALILFVYPVFRRLRITSVYSYLEMRFGVETRVTLAAAFIRSLSRVCLSAERSRPTNWPCSSSPCGGSLPWSARALA